MRRTLMSAQAPFMVFLAAAILLPARVPAQSPDCCNSLVVSSGLVTLGANATYDCVTVAPGAQLWTSNHTLTVTAPGGLNCGGDLRVQDFGRLVLTGGGTSVIDGVVLLTGSNSAVRVTTNSCAISGAGELRGLTFGGSLEIATGKTLTNQVRIRGRLALRPSVPGSIAFFHNEGTVRAELGTVSLHSLLVITDTGGARWEALNGTLQFSSVALGLLGGFRVDNSELAIYSLVTTLGPLEYTTGTVSVAALAVFSYGSDCCDSPHTPLPNPMIGPGIFTLNCP